MDSMVYRLTLTLSPIYGGEGAECKSILYLEFNWPDYVNSA